MPQKFTGRERDGENTPNMDYFGTRYYGSALGRFTSPDEFTRGSVDANSPGEIETPGPLPYADIRNPQSLNKYAHALNNPLRYTDPDGHCPTCEELEEEAVPVMEACAGGFSACGQAIEDAAEDVGSSIEYTARDIGNGAKWLGGVVAGWLTTVSKESFPCRGCRGTCCNMFSRLGFLVSRLCLQRGDPHPLLSVRFEMHSDA